MLKCSSTTTQAEEAERIANLSRVTEAPAQVAVVSAAAPGPGRERQGAIYRAGVLGSTSAVPTSFAALEQAAKKAATPRAGPTSPAAPAREARCATTGRRSTDGPSCRGWRTGGATRDLSVNLLGTQLTSPLLLAPIGAGQLIDPDADLRTARAAAATGVPYVFTNQVGTPMEECTAEMGSTPHWVQLYWSTDEALVDSLIGRAEDSGDKALVITLDTTVLGGVRRT